MMSAYVIHHRISSVANPHANSREELRVKTVKRMLHDNVSITGELDRAKFSQVLLQLRNTPDRDTRVSPAMPLYGRELGHCLPRPRSALMGDIWIKLADAAKSFRTEHTRALAPLKVGDHVLVQNQTGNHSNIWDKRAMFMKEEGHDQYQVLT